MGDGRATSVIGRRTELDLLNGVLRNLDRGSGITIRLRGEAGFGKTTLLDWVTTQTTAAVVRVTGSESEAELAYSGLSAMLRAFRVLRVEVPRPHAQVLSDAIGCGSTQGQLAVGGATLAAIAAAGEHTPLVLLIDDAQWLDEPSCATLAFALKRLFDEPVVAIISERAGVPSMFDNAGFETIELKGLGVDDALAILGEGTDREVAQRCVDAAEGSPLALVELAHRLDDDQRAGRVPLPDDLLVGNTLIRSFVDRVNALDAAAKRGAAVVAAALDPSAADIEAATVRLSAGPTDLAVVRGSRCHQCVARADRVGPSVDACGDPRRRRSRRHAPSSRGPGRSRRRCRQACLASGSSDVRPGRSGGRRSRSGRTPRRPSGSVGRGCGNVGACRGLVDHCS